MFGRQAIVDRHDQRASLMREVAANMVVTVEPAENPPAAVEERNHRQPSLAADVRPIKPIGHGAGRTGQIAIHDLGEALSAGIVDVEPLYRFISWSIFPEVYRRRQRAEKFEILVPDFIPLERIRNLPND